MTRIHSYLDSIYKLFFAKFDDGIPYFVLYIRVMFWVGLAYGVIFSFVALVNSNHGIAASILAAFVVGAVITAIAKFSTDV